MPYLNVTNNHSIKYDWKSNSQLYINDLNRDVIPIRKIVVFNIRSSTTHKELKEEFASYGEIIDCNLKKKSFEKSYAFITFKYSRHAYSALSDNSCYLDGRELRILPALAWHQPDRKKYTNESISTKKRLTAYNNYSSNDKSPITKLNEYCLVHIFGFLPLRDRIRIERVCRYWQIISTESLNLYKNFDSILNRDNWKYIKHVHILYEILEKFGQYITRVNGSDLLKYDSDKLILVAIARLCPNIEEIDLSNFPLSTSDIKALSKNCTKIKHISIAMSRYCNKEMQYKKCDKELSALFSKNRKLQYLHLKDYNYTIGGSCLKHLSTTTITDLSLHHVNCSLFIHIISKMQNLLALKIYFCINVFTLFENQGLKLNAEKLEKLTITPKHIVDSKFVDPNVDNFFKSSNLKNLKYLNLNNFVCIGDDLLFTLGDSLKHQLTYLDISHAKFLTNNGLIWIISSLSNLEHFHMQNMNENVTDEIFCCGMPKLKTLNCSNCPGIQDEGLIKFINNSEKLENLNVYGCNLITNKLIDAAINYTKHKTNDIILTIIVSRKGNITEIKENLPFLQLIQKC